VTCRAKTGPGSTSGSCATVVWPLRGAYGACYGRAAGSESRSRCRWRHERPWSAAGAMREHRGGPGVRHARAAGGSSRLLSSLRQSSSSGAARRCAACGRGVRGRQGVTSKTRSGDGCDVDEKQPWPWQGQEAGRAGGPRRAARPRPVDAAPAAPARPSSSARRLRRPGTATPLPQEHPPLRLAVVLRAARCWPAQLAVLFSRCSSPFCSSLPQLRLALRLRCGCCPAPALRGEGSTLHAARRCRRCAARPCMAAAPSLQSTCVVHRGHASCCAAAAAAAPPLCGLSAAALRALHATWRRRSRHGTSRAAASLQPHTQPLRRCSSSTQA
jgi:hypothetical protein